MQTETHSVGAVVPTRNALGAGIAGGFVGGVGMGIVLHACSNMMPLVGALYGWPTVVGGWIAHLGHSVLIGLLFAAIASRSVVRKQTSSVGGCVGVGVAYAAAVGLVTGGIMLPASLNAIGARTFPEPILPIDGVLGGILVVLSVGVAHVVYGLLLGATFGYVHEAAEEATERRSVAESS